MFLHRDQIEFNSMTITIWEARPHLCQIQVCVRDRRDGHNVHQIVLGGLLTYDSTGPLLLLKLTLKATKIENALHISTQTTKPFGYVRLAEVAGMWLCISQYA